MDLKSQNIKNLSIATNFIHKEIKSTHLNSQTNNSNIKSNPVKVTNHQIMDKMSNNSLLEKIDLF